MRAVLLTILFGASGLAMAGQESGCGKLVTEAECRSHRETLSRLTDADVRQAYLEAYRDLLRERAMLCGGPGQRQILARAYYR